MQSIQGSSTPRPVSHVPAADCSHRTVDADRVASARARILPDEHYADLAETFRALADSTRAKIVHFLLEQPLCVCDLAQIVGVSEPAVSQHLPASTYGQRRKVRSSAGAIRAVHQSSSPAPRSRGIRRRR